MSSPSILESTSARIFNIKRLIIFASISLGIHIIFVFLALPTLSKWGGQQDKKQANQQGVGVVELNAAEQSRLPNLTPPPAEIPQYSDPNSLNSSYFDPSFFSSNNTANNTPLLPPPPDSSGTIALDNGNIPSVVVPPQQSMPSSLPPSGTYPYTPPQQTPSLPAPPPSTNANTSNEERRQNIDFQPPQPPTQNPRQWLNDRTRIASNGGTPTGYPAGMPQQTNNGQNSVTRDPIQAHRDRVVRQRVVEIVQGAESLIADSENTSNDEAREREVNWRVKVKAAQPTEIALAGAYPKAACMRKLEGTAVYGVVVDNGGRVTQRPYLIQSAGYPIFNQQALGQIQSQNYSNQTGQPKPYRVTVNFQYSPKVCPAVAVVQPESTEKNPATAPPSQTQQSAPERAPATTGTTNTPNANPTPVDPGKAPETTQTTTTQNQQRNSSRQNWETTEPVQSKPASEATETTAPVQSKPTQENTNSATVAPRRATQTQSKPNPEASRPATTNEENTSMKPKPRSQSSSPTSANFRKTPEVRPLGTAAPRKVQDNSRGTSSEAPKPPTSEDN